MKRILIITALVAISSIGNAQQLGIQAGFNFANITGEVDTLTYKIGFETGILAEFQVGENFYLQPELLFTLQGAIDDEHSEDKVSLNYVVLPVLAKFFLTRGFNVQIGPRIGLLVMAQTTLDETDIQIEDQLNSTDFGLIGGVGYQRNRWSASARYYHGLTDIHDASNVDVGNQILQFAIGFFIVQPKEGNPMLRD